ncbi:hypothetical protein ABZ016_20040 [Streptomyces sp. NPDC006372]
METVTTVGVALGVLLMQLFTTRHADRMPTLPSGRSRRWRLWPWHRTET